MSLKTWKVEYYPVALNKVPESEALNHSLTKWKGLRPVNLDIHDISINKYGNIEDIFGNVLEINSESCALCYHYIDMPINCPECPISIARGHNCSKEYYIYRDKFDPEPMITLLESIANGQ